MVKQRHNIYRKLEKEKESDSSGDETELFVRNKSPKKEIPTVKKEIEDGDTLQSLAIRYHCSIEELKRLNGIHKENEIFAKRVIKVPHRPFTAALAGVHVSGKSSPNGFNEPPTSQLIDIDSLNSKLTESVASTSKDTTIDEVNEIIFNSNIAPSNKSYEEVATELNEEVCLLPQNSRLSEAEPIAKLDCSGADGDISWVTLVVCIGFITIVGPIIYYLLYMVERPEQPHHHVS